MMRIKHKEYKNIYWEAAVNVFVVKSCSYKPIFKHKKLDSTTDLICLRKNSKSDLDALIRQFGFNILQCGCLQANGQGRLN